MEATPILKKREQSKIIEYPSPQKEQLDSITKKLIKEITPMNQIIPQNILRRLSGILIEIELKRLVNQQYKSILRSKLLRRVDEHLNNTNKKKLLDLLIGLDEEKLSILYSFMIIIENYLENSEIRDDVKTLSISYYQDAEIENLATIYIKITIKTNKRLKEIWPIWKNLRKKAEEEIRKSFGEKS